MPEETDTIEFSIESTPPTIRASLLAFSEYPRICHPPIDIEISENGAGQLDLKLPEGCTMLTMVLVDVTRPGEGGARTVEWVARALGPPLNRRLTTPLPYNDPRDDGVKDEPTDSGRVQFHNVQYPQADIIRLDTAFSGEHFLLIVTLGGPVEEAFDIRLHLDSDRVSSQSVGFFEFGETIPQGLGPCGENSSVMRNPGSVYTFAFAAYCDLLFYEFYVVVDMSTEIVERSGYYVVYGDGALDVTCVDGAPDLPPRPQQIWAGPPVSVRDVGARPSKKVGLH